MPQPRRKSSQAPNETRNQKGSCLLGGLISWLQRAGGRGRTYHRDNVLLDGDREGNELEVEGEVELLGVGEVSYYRIGLVRTGRQRTELRRRAREMVCCACVMVRLRMLLVVSQLR